MIAFNEAPADLPGNYASGHEFAAIDAALQ